MKKIILCFIYVIISCLYIINVNAVCSYEEQAKLNQEAANIKVAYEEKNGLRENEDCADSNEPCTIKYDYFDISILNLSENFSVNVTNKNVANENKFNKSFNYSDAKDGIITFKFEEIMLVQTFTFKITATDKTNCGGSQFRTLYLTTPRKNLYYYNGICKGLDKELSACQKYVTFEEEELDEVVKKVDDYNNRIQEEIEKEKNDSLFENIIEFFIENKITIIIVLGVTILSIITVTVIVKKRNRVI